MAAFITSCEPEAKQSPSPFIYCGIDGIANRALTSGVLANTPSNPIVLATEGDLRLLGCADGIDRLKASYILANDITLTKEWEPLGAFSGTLDGAGYSIKNLTINKGSTNKVGLVSDNYGSIINIGIEIGAAGVVGKDIVGAVVGTNSGTVRAVVRGPGAIIGDNTVGGLAGENQVRNGIGGKISGVVLADVKATGIYIGGLVGASQQYSGSVVGYVAGNVTGFVAPLFPGGVGGVVGFSTLNSVIGYHAGKSVTGETDTAGGVGQLKSNTNFSGYARSKIILRTRSGTSNGQVIGEGSSTAAYYSATESTASVGTLNNTGTSITIDATKTQKETGYFDGLTFGTAEGEWTFHQGKWPSINLPADKIFDPYRGALQPIDP